MATCFWDQKQGVAAVAVEEKESLQTLGPPVGPPGVGRKLFGSHGPGPEDPVPCATPSRAGLSSFLHCNASLHAAAVCASRQTWGGGKLEMGWTAKGNPRPALLWKAFGVWKRNTLDSSELEWLFHRSEGFPRTTFLPRYS